MLCSLLFLQLDWESKSDADKEKTKYLICCSSKSVTENVPF